jgi:hypothetical protein
MSALPSRGAVPHILLGMTATTGIVDAVRIVPLGQVSTANIAVTVLFLGFALAGARGFSIPRLSMAVGTNPRWHARVASVLLMLPGPPWGAFRRGDSRSVPPGARELKYLEWPVWRQP